MSLWKYLVRDVSGTVAFVVCTRPRSGGNRLGKFQELCCLAPYTEIAVESAIKCIPRTMLG